MLDLSKPSIDQPVPDAAHSAHPPGLCGCNKIVVHFV